MTGIAMITKTVKYHIPKVPTFLIQEVRPVQRQDGFSEAPKTRIDEFSDDELRFIGEQWTDALITRAHELRKEQP